MNTSTTTTSGFFSISVRDTLQALITATILPALTVIQGSLEAGEFKLNWHKIAVAASLGFVTHILRKFFSPPTIVVKAPKETVEAVKNGDAEVSVKPN